MKNLHLQIVIIFFAFFTISLNGAENETLRKLKSQSEEAFFHFDEKKFMEIIGLCERINTSEQNNADAAYYSAYSKYRLVNIGMSKNKKDVFEKYFQSALDETNKLVNDPDYGSDAKVVQAAVYMMKLATDLSDAPAISMKIHTLLGQAETLRNDNPRVFLVRGVMILNTPEQFGGSIDGALEQFKTALQFYNSQNENENVTWGKYEALTWTGIAHQKKGNLGEAKKIYTNILSEAPNFGWVKYDLLPALEKTGKPENNTKPDVVSPSLIVKINGFENNSGMVRVTLNNSEESYDTGNSFKEALSEIINNTAEITFRDLPPGEYAVSCFHDENGNEKLDKNMFGAPSEAYGFSNDARGTFGPPSFEESKFILGENSTEIVIKVK